MKSKFITAIGILILILVVLSTVLEVRYIFTGNVFLNLTASDSVYLVATLLCVTLILATLFVHEFLKPIDGKSWFTLVTVWGFNIFTLLYVFGIINLGEEAGTSTVFLVLILITLIIDFLAYIPYEVFRKHEAKP